MAPRIRGKGAGASVFPGAEFLLGERLEQRFIDACLAAHGAEKAARHAATGSRRATGRRPRVMTISSPALARLMSRENCVFA